ncbi:GMC family oxidoreductase [Hymenobacter gummosus]|uniref:GMC family oxidoreductase n=1 Tax=Hymenobacter gummosus TaxID=1776032 RepID=A0A431U2S1_9BACT|nr:GMC family oxidoreductase [Hymenobacter gummosus]RTQ49697.1 GMC family oxidoreductase [Hymenobacter gummosus]
MHKLEHYDVVIVGGGIAGAIMAKQLSHQQQRVLVLEAGAGDPTLPYDSYLAYLDEYYRANIKVPNAPYPDNPNAPQPSVLDTAPIAPPVPNTAGYFVQRGPNSYGSDYTRALGGTTLHWLGTTLRMLPEDFELHSRYGRGVDWPISYDDLLPYYEMAEREIGVSADVEDQQFLGLHFSPGYVFPMHKIPQSYLDMWLTEKLADLQVERDGQAYPVRVVSTPQGRNGMPNPAYNNGEGYVPVGAVGRPDLGQRCQGNSSCVPICPVQAKYNAWKTLAAANPAYVEVQTQCVASRVLVDGSSGYITGIEYKHYDSQNSGAYTTHVARGTRYVLAAHAIENAKLLLASNVANRSGQVGRNLMDHPVLLTWALLPEATGPFRGPGSTSGIPSLRGGEFRANGAAWRVEIDNWGWNWPTGAPYSSVDQLVDGEGRYGADLRQRLNAIIQGQVRLGFLVEQLPDPFNRVTIDPDYMDRLGNYRPVIDYTITDYTSAGFAAAKQVSDAIYDHLWATDYTSYSPADAGHVTYRGQGYSYRGAGHYVGTHRMGTDPDTSVVDPRQRSWDHPNLYLVGCGNMPTIATSNPTLTMAALTFWAARNLLEDIAADKVLAGAELSALAE